MKEYNFKFNYAAVLSHKYISKVLSSPYHTPLKVALVMGRPLLHGSIGMTGSIHDLHTESLGASLKINVIKLQTTGTERFDAADGHIQLSWTTDAQAMS